MNGDWEADPYYYSAHNCTPILVRDGREDGEVGDVSAGEPPCHDLERFGPAGMKVRSKALKK